jgi:hypothetical protein
LFIGKKLVLPTGDLHVDATNKKRGGDLAIAAACFS